MENKKIHILITEDNPMDVRLIKEMFKSKPNLFIEITHAGSLDDTIKKLKNSSFEIILLDLNLPDSFGLGTLREIIKHAPWIPVVVLTGADDENLGLEAIKNQASDYLIKGKIDVDTLIRSIRYAIERKKSEDRLCLQAHILESVNDAVMISDLSYRITSWNQGAERLYGWKEYEVLGKLAMDVFRSEMPDKERTRICQNLEKGESVLVEFVHHTRDNRKIIVGGYLMPIRDTRGIITNYLSINHDITEQKKAQEVLSRDKESLEKIVKDKTNELLTAYLEIEKIKRLSDIGTLAATIAHELRNPLAGINLAAYNLKRKIDNPGLQKYIQKIENKVIEGDQIINNLLFYSRLKQPNFECINIKEILSEVIEQVSSNTKNKKKVSIIAKIDSIADTPIEVDPLQIKELFHNIVNNAFDAIPDINGTIEISSKQDNDNRVLIYVKDNGSGIDSENLNKIWEPFFSTKSKGTGLGLSVCRQITLLHNGSIDIKSEKEKGTTVIIGLPYKQTNSVSKSC